MQPCCLVYIGHWGPGGEGVCILQSGHHTTAESGQDVGTSDDPAASVREAELSWGMVSRGYGSCFCRMAASVLPGSRDSGVVQCLGSLGGNYRRILVTA